MKTASKLVAMLVVAVALGCGNDVDDERIGAECTANSACENEEFTCLTQFKGGYRGSSGCTKNAD